MIKIDVPGYKKLSIHHLVLDYNGTLAEDGDLLTCAAPLLLEIQNNVIIHILTADTHGTVQEKLKEIDCRVHIIGPENQTDKKLRYIEKLRPENVVAIGNGRNDLLMLKYALVGIGLIQREGGYTKSLLEADIICPDIESALQLLLKPKRLIATLRG